ncbi:hypothetical protein T9A_02537 [Alcanivorax jadensis T9]|jgi:cytoskeleton protein RodZ|uniref:HTH cro/C1-type domain-containing protein n=1 Tax=Alcanivorax jadensis T9 TaxID=1177181 RepID=A0ABR4WAV9_9GAMM|nr:RodZ domain-containing protein [Alcanivorax jadensis]KGD60360.1 hypothetical protein T9A_02537 [Alcanivorax jadensis T9]MBP21798.1 DUF4115 domain-containing protein [Alcanivorax sp.]
MSDNMVVLPGERCRKAREALGWTPAEAAKKMHLSQSYLVALEADDYERLPEATFVKGYLKNYARLLGLPADEIANTFQQIVNDDAFDKPLDLPKMAPPPSVWRKPLLAVVALLVVVALLIWLWPEEEALAPLSTSGMNAPEERVSLQADEEVGGETGPFPGEPESAPEQGAGDELSPQSLDDTANDAQPEDTGAAADGNSAESLNSVESSDEPAPSMLAENGLDRLLMAFSGNCWISVKDATGRTLRQGEQQGGASLQLDGKAPFSLTLGDAGAVDELILNGEVVTLPTNSPGTVVRVSIP